MGNIQKQMSLHMPIYRNKEQNSNTDNLTHPKLQLLQHAITSKNYYSLINDFQMIKQLNFFLAKNSQNT